MCSLFLCACHAHTNDATRAGRDVERAGRRFVSPCANKTPLLPSLRIFLLFLRTPRKQRSRVQLSGSKVISRSAAQPLNRRKNKKLTSPLSIPPEKKRKRADWRRSFLSWSVLLCRVSPSSRSSPVQYRACPHRRSARDPNTSHTDIPPPHIHHVRVRQRRGGRDPVHPRERRVFWRKSFCLIFLFFF